MELSKNLIKTTALRNETGSCLVNSFLRVVLNSDTLTTTYIEFSHKVFGQNARKTISMYKNDLFNHLPDITTALPALIGLYCDMFYIFHKENGDDAVDVRNRILYVGAHIGKN